MIGRLAAMACVVTLGGGAWGDTYRVKNTRDTGTHSLRWAITEANSRTGPDNIKFAATLAGSTLRPKTALPAITDGPLVINGDTDGNGMPDIALNGSLCASGDGLVVDADRVDVIGLSINRFPRYGLYSSQHTELRISACHLGASLDGMNAAPNGEDNVCLVECGLAQVKAIRPGDSTVIGAGGLSGKAGLRMHNCSECRVKGNYVGVDALGGAALKAKGSGIWLSGNTASPGNEIISNTFGGMFVGVVIMDSSGHALEGNHFGLGPGGDPLPIAYAGVDVAGALAENNRVGRGGGTANVFAYCGKAGVKISGSYTRVCGNRFGMNAGGTQTKELRVGVHVERPAGYTWIGGSETTDGNYFTCTTTKNKGEAIRIETSAKTRVRNNIIGALPTPGSVTGMRTGMWVRDGNAWITDNTMKNAGRGVVVEGAMGKAGIYNNTFGECKDGVLNLGAGWCHLGDLGNAQTNDDGGNSFDRFSMVWFVRNYSADALKAEGNSYGTQWGTKIDAKIWDGTDDASLGVVDFDPLNGGVSSKGEGIIGVSGLTALPTAAGAQVTFALAGPATVEARVMNLAGRPVKTLCRAKELQAGGNTLLWDATSDNGLAAPGGVYLVEVLARGEDGGQARALGQVRVR